MKIFLQALFIVILSYFVNCAKILGIFHVPSYSHHTLGVKLLKPLAERGHEVTMISPFKLKDEPKNWRDIVLEGFEKPTGDKRVLYDMAYLSSPKKLFVVSTMGFHMTNMTLHHPNVVEFLQRKNETFDLIILEKFFNEAHLGFAYHFGAPYIILSTIGSSRWINDIIGNPGSPAYIPDLFLEYSADMSFWDRLHNTLFYVLAESFGNLYMFPKSERLLKEHFPGAPPLEDLYYNASLILTNSHFSIKEAVPTVPSMIEVGGFHVDPPKKLAEDLQEFLDEAKDGVIYFSLGSNVQVKDMSEGRRNSILKSFSKVKQRVLWKWEDESLPELPPNVKVSKWFPQQDVLAHPNIILFISHGGLLSTIEALTYGVPLLNIPIFAEQLMNSAEAESHGYGIGIPYKDFTEQKFQNALTEILTNESYRRVAKHRSRVLKDQPITPLEKAIFWTEYVIRHKGAPQLRSVTLNLKWYQYIFLDIIAFLVFITLLFTLIIYKTIRIFITKRHEMKVEKNEKNIKKD